MLGYWWLRMAGIVVCARGVHVSDNGDGTYTNPVMPNAHWSDPAVLRVGSDYYVVSSSIETSPNLQILHSLDLVNWDVVGSVSRYWYVMCGMRWSLDWGWPAKHLVAGRCFRMVVGAWNRIEHARTRAPACPPARTCHAFTP
jgi:hypothetical protein